MTNSDMLSPLLLENVNICNQITSYLDPVSFVCLTRVSKQLRIPLRNERWNLSRKLEKFFDDPEDFRSALRQSCALIGGDFARQFFRGLIAPNQTLDVYVERGTQADWFCDYLETRWGYKQVWASSNLDVSEASIHKVLAPLSTYPGTYDTEAYHHHSTADIYGRLHIMGQSFFVYRRP